MKMARYVFLFLVSALISCSHGDGSGGESPASTASVESSAGCELPAEYVDLPLVPECFHVSDHRIAAQASTTLSQDEAIAFFEKALPEKGWTIEERKTMDENIIHLALSGHGVRSAWVEVGARDSDEDRSIGVTYYVN